MGKYYDDATDSHNAAEKDGSKGEYNPPSEPTLIDSFWNHDQKWSEFTEAKEAYDQGFENGDKQR